jgi:hypothetical protein
LYDFPYFVAGIRRAAFILCEIIHLLCEKSQGIMVKKGGVMASTHVGGFSGAFIPVSEDEGMAAAVKKGTSREALIKWREEKSTDFHGL